MKSTSEFPVILFAVPASTTALIVTDGNIPSLEGFNLSFLFNTSLLRLNNNGITTISHDAFLGLRSLKSLFLDQNQISSSSITYSTFHELQKLQILVLSNNVLSSIHGGWFTNMKELIRLHLNGNQLQSITCDSFEMANLGNLRSLDLSNNFISSIQKNAFQGLTQLVEMDLSRNRLALIPDTFSPLTHLNFLGLDHNRWNCTCKLYDLVAFLRTYMNSSSRTLKNADNLSCRESENPAVMNLLDLTEVNCKSTPKGSSGILKTQRKNYRRDIALIAVFAFLGGVALTCLLVALLNRKLQYGKANERTSENCCCRTPDESQCGHEPRNHLTKGYCNCHLTQENEIKVMPIWGSGRDLPLSQENSHQETVKAECKSRGIQKEKEQMRNDSFSCLNCRRLQSYPPQERSWPTAVPHEEALYQKHFQRRTTSPEIIRHWEEDSCITGSEDHSKWNQGIRSGIVCRRYSRPVCTLGKGRRLEKHLGNEFWRPQSPVEDDSFLKTHRQRHFIAGLSSAPSTPEDSKEHCVRTAVENHRSNCDDRCGSFEKSTSISPQLDKFLIYKYIDCDKYQDYPTEKKQKNHGKKLRLEKEQSAVESRGASDCCVSVEEMPAGAAVKRTYQPKSVSFYVPNLATLNRADVTMSSLSDLRAPKNKQRMHEDIEGNPWPVLAMRLLSDLEVKSKDRKPFPASSGLAGKGQKKNNKLIQKSRMRPKSQDFLAVKLNLQPFRKATIHPQEVPPLESSEQHQCCQNKNHLTELHQKWLQASKKDTMRRKRKEKTEFADGGQRDRRSENGVKMGTSLFSDKNTNRSIHSGASALKITEGPSSVKHLQTPAFTSTTFPSSPNETSSMTVPATALLSDNLSNISQNAENHIPISVNSKELTEDAAKTTALFFHEDSPMSEGKDKGTRISLTSNLEVQCLSNADNLQLQVTENTVQRTNLEHLGNPKLKRQNENATIKDGLEGFKRAERPKSEQRNLVSTESQSTSGRSLSASSHYQILTEMDRTKSPIALSTSEAIGCRLTIQEGRQTQTGLNGIAGMEIHGNSTIEEQGTGEKPESNSELTQIFIPTTPMDFVVLKEGEAETGDEWKNNRCKIIHTSTAQMPLISDTLSMLSSPETGNVHLESNSNDLELNNNVPPDNENDLQEVSNNQLDEGSSEHKAGRMPPETHQDISLQPEFKDVSCKEQMERSLIPCSTNETKLPVPKSLLPPTSTKYDKELPLQVEQSKAIFSNNRQPSLTHIKDKKPYSV